MQKVTWPGTHRRYVVNGLPARTLAFQWLFGPSMGSPRYAFMRGRAARASHCAKRSSRTILHIHYSKTYAFALSSACTPFWRVVGSCMQHDGLCNAKSEDIKGMRIQTFMVCTWK